MLSSALARIASEETSRFSTYSMRNRFSRLSVRCNSVCTSKTQCKIKKCFIWCLSTCQEESCFHSLSKLVVINLFRKSLVLKEEETKFYLAEIILAIDSLHSK
jgi:hypothetical protein